MGKYLILLLIILSGCKLKKGTNTLLNSKNNIEYASDSMQIEYVSDSMQIEYYDNMLVRSAPPPPMTMDREITTIENPISNVPIQSTVSMGQIVYNIPDTMNVLQDYKIVIRISKESNLIDIQENLNGRTVRSELRVENRMEVKIVDPSGNNFNIIPINRERQLVENGEYTQWSFSVTPLKSGENLKLDLVVSIIIGEDIKEIVYTDSVLVKSSPTKQVKSWWDRNWNWMVEVMLIPFGIWIWNYVRDRLKKKS